MNLLKSRWVWLAAALAFFLLVLLTLPLSIRYGMEMALVRLGAEGVRIEDVDFNPFARRLSARNVSLKAQGIAVSIPQMHLRFRWTPLKDRRVYIEEASIDALSLDIQGRVRFPLRPRKWDFGFGHVVLKEGVLNFRAGESKGTFTVERAEVKGLSTWEREKASETVFLGSLDGGRVEFRGTSSPFGDVPRLTGSLKAAGFSVEPLGRFTGTTLTGEAGLEGRLDASFGKAASLGIEDATVTIKRFGSEGKETSARGELLEWKGDLKLSYPWRFAALGDISLKGLRIDDASRKITPFEVKSGRLRFSGEGDSGRLAGSLDGTGLSVILRSPPRTTRIEKVSLSGRLNSGFSAPEAIVFKGSVKAEKTSSEKGATLTQNELLEWKGDLRFASPGGLTALGDISLKGLRMNDTSKGITLLEVEAVRCEKAELAGAHISIGSVEARGVVAGRPGKGEEFFRAGLVAVNGFRGFTEIRAGDVKLGDASLLLRITEGGRVYMASDIIKGGLRLRTGQVGVYGSAVVFEDARIEPRFRLTLEIDEGYIKELNSMDRALESGFAVEGTLDKYTDVSIAGKARPFAKRPTLSFTGKVESLDLPPFSRYIVEASGYRIVTGQMDANLDVRITEGVIESENEVTLKNIEVSTVEAGKVEEFVSELTMPLEVALSLLTDRDGNVYFKLPVTGDITSPRFSFSDAMERAALEGLKKSGLLYLKYYFQPYGSFILLGKIALRIGGEIARVRLDPVFFAPGSPSLDPEALLYLEKVSGLMIERPGIRIKLCGIVTPGEGLKEKALPGLARERAELIKDLLVQDYGISPERLFVCLPEVDREEGARPRVELLI